MVTEVRGVRGGWADSGFIWNPVVNDSWYKLSCGDDEEGWSGKVMVDMAGLVGRSQLGLLLRLGQTQHNTDLQPKDAFRYPLFIMASSALSGIRSPASPRSGATSPRPNKFDSDLLKTYIKKLLASTLQTVPWPEFKERERGRALMKEVGDRVKERMLGTLVPPSEARKLNHL